MQTETLLKKKEGGEGPKKPSNTKLARKADKQVTTGYF